MTESKSDPENFNVQRSEFSVQRSGPSGRPVFLSYASQDAEAARRICDALRASGVEVWFDQSQLVGGDAWNLKIHPIKRFDRTTTVLNSTVANPTFALCRETRSH